MPLRNHFLPPLSKRSSWEEVHGGWPMVIVQQLGKILPEQYVAGPRVHLGSSAEVDVATFEQHGEEIETHNRPYNVGPVATALWTPTEPTLVMETEMGDFDEYEVRVYDASRSRRLVAAIELISPANKDRPESRHQFVCKCAALLRQQVSVVLVDLVSSRDFNLYAELLELTSRTDPTFGEAPSSMYAVACRWRSRGANHVLETWNYVLSHGQPLPILPLWLSDDLAIPLDLEASYEQTCRDLRIV